MTHSHHGSGSTKSARAAPPHPAPGPVRVLPRFRAGIAGVGFHYESSCSKQVKSIQRACSPDHPQISTTDMTHARTEPDTQRAQAHSHTQTTPINGRHRTTPNTGAGGPLSQWTEAWSTQPAIRQAVNRRGRAREPGRGRVQTIQSSRQSSRLPLFLQYPDSIDIGFRREARFGVRAPYRYRYRRSVAACIVLTLFYIVGIRIQIHLIGHSSRGSNGGCQIKCFEPKRVCEPLPPLVIPSPLLPALNALPPPPS